MVYLRQVAKGTTSLDLRFRTVAVSILLGCLMQFTAAGQDTTLLKQGAWTVSAPSGPCGSLPLLQVKGPGTLFESTNASALAEMEQALAGPLSKACPGAREAILTNGRGRKLIRLASTAAAVPAQQPSPLAPPNPRTASTESSGDASPSMAAQSRNVSISSAKAPPPQSAEMPQRSTEPPPSIPAKSNLPAMASVHGIQGKCDLALKWLETGKTSALLGRVSYALPPQMLDIFRDETMTALFGMPYDQADNRWRIEQYETVFGECMGDVRPANRPTSIGGVGLGQVGQLGRLGQLGQLGKLGSQTTLPHEYAQEFRQYAEVLHEAFQGTPGRFETAAIIRHVQSVREQVNVANSEMTSAAAARATLEAFKQILGDRDRLAQKLAMLSAAEREQVSQYLGRRQVGLSPTIVQSWLDEAGKQVRNPASAKTLQAQYRSMSQVLATLDSSGRASADSSYDRLVEEDIGQTIEAERAELLSFAVSWEGARKLAEWEASLLNRFGDFKTSKALSDAMTEFETTRARTYSALLPAWQKRMSETPLKESELAKRQQDLNSLFVSQADRATPLFADYAKPLVSRQKEMQQRQAEEERQRLAKAEREAAAEAQRAAGVKAPNNLAANNSHQNSERDSARSGPLTSLDLKLPSGPDGELLGSLYAGEFDKVSLDRSSTAFSAIMHGYMEGFSSACSTHIHDPVELTTPACDAQWVTTDRYGLQTPRGCSHWHNEGTGIYAERDFHDAANSTPTQQAGSSIRTVLNAMSGSDPLGGAMNMVANVTQLAADAKSVVLANSCTSAGLKRFKENLQMFALGKTGVRLDGTTPIGVAMLPAAPGESYRDSNYGKLLDNMVTVQSKSWAVNRYISGSIRTANVVARDSSGRPAKIMANYSYNGFSNRQEGIVTLEFEDGRPQCLFFSDQPATCRTPDHSLTSAYINGNYR